ncbi:MAG: aldehyde dehydrogenase family protein, partial [Dermatophilaceae bacterium]
MHQYIGGERREGSTGERFDVLDPSTDETIETVALAGPDDVDAAVVAASSAFEEWSRATPVERSTVLLAAARLLDERAEELARLESRQAGKPIRLAREFDVPGTVDNTAFFGTAARRLDGMASAEYSGDHTSSVRREPIGVVGSVAPWNYPLQMAAWKVLPAIAAGNTIVLKPAEITPLTALLFAEAFTEAGAPAGVVNVVTGTGPVAGEALVGHPDVAMTSFTGSTAVGRRVMALA